MYSAIIQIKLTQDVILNPLKFEQQSFDQGFQFTGFVRLRENLENPEKETFLKKNQGKPGKLREFSDHFYNLRENPGNFILPNISDQIGGAIRISEASK